MRIYEEIIEINKELGSVLVRPSSLDFACDKASYEKNTYKKVAYIIRAIIVDHPFFDFNKSSATIITKRIFERENIMEDKKNSKGKYTKYSKNRKNGEKMLSKKEIKIFEMWQFFDKYRVLPFEKKRIDVTLSMENIVKLKKKSINVSGFIDRLIKKSV